jgi:S-adenosylmethionine decarboxylase
MEAASRAGATVKKVCYADLGGDSPPGCTVCVLLDESHITAHTYADSGLVAVNVFTCGEKANPVDAIAWITGNIGGHILWDDLTDRFKDCDAG